jgi:hypothetical protein
MHKLLLRPTTANMSDHALNKRRWRHYYYLINTKTKCLYRFIQFKFTFNTINTDITNLLCFNLNVEYNNRASSTKQNTFPYTTLTFAQKGVLVCPFIHSPY